MSLAINGLKSNIFSKAKLRQALQYLLWDAIFSKKLKESNFIQGAKFDPQIFMPTQAGRIGESEVNEILAQGKQYVSEFIKQSKVTPIKIVSRPDVSWLTNVFDEAGISYTVRQLVPSKEAFQIYYKTFDADIITYSFSISHGDPDGVYHALGEKGAIASKMIVRKKVSELLEQGRQISDINKIHEHYQKVTRAVLEEVPYVHLGFAPHVYVYRKKAVRIKDQVLTRTHTDLSVFERFD